MIFIVNDFNEEYEIYENIFVTDNILLLIDFIKWNKIDSDGSRTFEFWSDGVLKHFYTDQEYELIIRILNCLHKKKETKCQT